MKKFSKEECYRFIFENSMDAILLTAPDGKIYRANPAACDLFQMSEEEICKAGRMGVVDTKDPRLLPALKERAEKGKLRSELNFIKKNKEVFPADVSSAIFMDDEGRAWTVLIIRDISAHKMLEDKESFAYIDYLTEIYNRRALIDNLQNEMARTARENTSLSLLMVDIDHFKDINDKLGHLCGDFVLQKFAKCLSENIRKYDTVGRYGGEEFMIVLPHTNIEQAKIVAERIRSSIEKKMFEDMHITISGGLKQYNNEDLAEFVHQADLNLYQAKGTGKNKVIS